MTFIDLVKNQLQKGLLRADTTDGEDNKYVLPLPYSYTEKTRLKWFPYYKRGDHSAYGYFYSNDPSKLHRERYENDRFNKELLNDLGQAMSKIGHNLGSKQIKYITCRNCNDSMEAVEIIIMLKEESTEATTGESAETASAAEEPREKESDADANDDANDDDNLRAGGRKSKRRKSKRRKSAKKSKSLKLK